MTDLKNFDKPTVFDTYEDFVDTIRENLNRVMKFDDEGAINVPVGFIKIDLNDNNLRLLQMQEDGNYKTIFNFNYLITQKFNIIPVKVEECKLEVKPFEKLEDVKTVKNYFLQQPTNITQTALAGLVSGSLQISASTLQKALNPLSTIIAPGIKLIVKPQAGGVKNNLNRWDNISKDLISFKEDIRRLTPKTIRITSPGWVSMIIIGPGGPALTGGPGAPYGTYDNLSGWGFEKIREGTNTKVSGSALRESFLAAGIDPNYTITVPGFSGDSVNTDMPATFTKEQMDELKGLEVDFYRGGRSYKPKNQAGRSIAIGGPSGAIRLTGTDIDKIPHDFGYSGHVNRGFGQGQYKQIRVGNFNKGLGQSDGGDVIVQNFVDFNNDIRPFLVINRYSDIGYGGGSSIDANAEDFPVVTGGGGGAMIKLRIYLNIGELKITIINTFNDWKRQSIRTARGGFISNIDPTIHGGLNGGPGAVIIMSIPWRK